MKKNKLRVLGILFFLNFLLVMSTSGFSGDCIADDPGECVANCPDDSICCVGESPLCVAGNGYVQCGFDGEYKPKMSCRGGTILE